MLPVMPHLQPGLQVESEERRLDAVDLICKLLTQPAGHTLLTDYPHLPEAVLGRLNDRSAEVRHRVLSHARFLADSLPDDTQRGAVAEAVATRLQDHEERLRAAAAAALCAIAAEHPLAVRTAHYEVLLNRLRDKRLGVRKEVASQISKLVKAWCLRAEDGTAARAGGVRRRFVVQLVLGLCRLAMTQDTELAAYILDDLFKTGVFPARLPPASAAGWWGLAWKEAGAAGQASLGALLKDKCDMQLQVQELLRLRERVKGDKAAAAARASGADSSSAVEAGASPNPAAQMQARLAKLAAALKGVHKAEEGLEKLFAMKDNHIVRGLATLAAFGTPHAEAAAAGKDLQGRVGSRGPAAEVAQTLAARLTPNIIFPEILAAALESDGDSPEGERETGSLFSTVLPVPLLAY